VSAATSITVRVPLKIRRRPGRKTVVMPVPTADTAIPTRADPALVKALARAFRYQKLLDEGQYASISEMAAAERIDRGYLGTLLRLTLLAPELVEAFLDGRERWLGKFGQADEWISCLTAAKLPRIRREHDEANAPDA